MVCKEDSQVEMWPNKEQVTLMTGLLPLTIELIIRLTTSRLISVFSILLEDNQQEEIPSTHWFKHWWQEMKDFWNKLSTDKEQLASLNKHTSIYKHQWEGLETFLDQTCLYQFLHAHYLILTCRIKAITPGLDLNYFIKIKDISINYDTYYKRPNHT